MGLSFYAPRVMFIYGGLHNTLSIVDYDKTTAKNIYIYCRFILTRGTNSGKFLMRILHVV